MRLKNRNVIFCCVITFGFFVLWNVIERESDRNRDKTKVMHYSSYCNCTRSIVVKASGVNGNGHWCGVESTMRGPHQNVVVYSLYGNAIKNDKPTTYYLILDTLPLEVNQFYPDWVIRIYHNLKTNKYSEHKKLCNMYCNNPNVDLCDINWLINSVQEQEKKNTVPIADNLISHMNPRLWRYLPMMDSLVDRIMSRDIDAEVGEREAAAVKQWLESNRTFHIIRDHHFHCYPNADNFQPIMAGLFGVKINQKREMVDALTRVMTTIGDQQEYYVDQLLLARVFWPIAKDDAVIHDSHCCMYNWNSLPASPFPTQRINGTFISDRRGSSWARPKKCPVQCRPPDHQDWEYC